MRIEQKMTKNGWMAMFVGVSIGFVCIAALQKPKTGQVALNDTQWLGACIEAANALPDAIPGKVRVATVDACAKEPLERSAQKMLERARAAGAIK